MGALGVFFIKIALLELGVTIKLLGLDGYGKDYFAILP
jgi:hypothetical protein